MKKIIASGTFDRLHEGHKFFLKTAFNYGYVLIGLTSDEMIRNKEHADRIWGFEKRKDAIMDFLNSLGYEEGKNYEIIKIEDKYGFSLKKDADYILVTDETYKNAVDINRERKKRGLKELKIIKIGFVEDEKGRISSTRLRS
ncbi:MAG: pantetheine-phosphate adenylyltransferase [Methanomicrobia archaeon]|nr:pantetheine-phosphate adenylyltransferase [Methanomicrobia archaeon]